MVYRCIKCRKMLHIETMYWKTDIVKIIEMRCNEHGKVLVEYKYMLDASRYGKVDLFFKCNKMDISKFVVNIYNSMKKLVGCSYLNFGFEYIKNDFKE